jgi:hypothetical protein
MELLASPFVKGAATALIAYSAHYGMVKAYSAACVPDGFWGFVQGLVTAGSPVCQAGVQIISSTQMTYGTVITLGITRLVLDLVAPGAGDAVPTETPS